MADAKTGRPSWTEMFKKTQVKDEEISQLNEELVELKAKQSDLENEKLDSQVNYVKPDEEVEITSQTEAQARWQKSIDERPTRLLEEGEAKLIVPPHILDEIRGAGYQDFFPLRSQIAMKEAEGWIRYTDANGAGFEIPSRNGTPGDDHVLMMLPVAEAEAIKQRAYAKANRQTKAIKDKARKGDGGGSFYTPDGARF